MSNQSPYDPNRQQWQQSQGYSPPPQKLLELRTVLKVWIGIIIGLVLVVGGCLAYIDYYVDQTVREIKNSNGYDNRRVNGNPDNPVTLEKFNRIKKGMAKNEVEQILGITDTMSSSYTLGGYKTESYTWDAPGFGSMSAVFQNGKLVSKSQFGLK